MVRGYRYRLHPAESELYERCIGFAWCRGCHIFAGAQVHVPRRVVLPDPLADLPPQERRQLRRSESQLIEYLDGLDWDAPS